MKQLQLTDQELDLVFDALAHLSEVHLDMSSNADDDDGKLHTALSTLESELLYQKVNGERRPIWQNYSTLEAWQEHTFISSSGKTPDFVAFAKRFRLTLSAQVVSQFEIISWTVGHFYISGFLKNKKTGKYVYFSLPDVRFQPGKWYSEILIRTAKSDKDFTGGHNNYTTLDRFTVVAMALSQG